LKSGSRGSGRHQKKKRKDARETQLVWTFFVGLAVLAAAFYQLGTPKNSLLHRTISSMPEAVSTAHPIIEPSTRPE